MKYKHELKTGVCCKVFENCLFEGIIEGSQKSKDVGGYEYFLLLGVSEIRTGEEREPMELFYCPNCGTCHNIKKEK